MPRIEGAANTNLLFSVKKAGGLLCARLLLFLTLTHRHFVYLWINLTLRYAVILACTCTVTQC